MTYCVYNFVVRDNSRNSAHPLCLCFVVHTLSLVPLHKLRHARRAQRSFGTHFVRDNSRNSAQHLCLCFVVHAIASSTAQTSARKACSAKFWYSLRAWQLKKLGTTFVPLFRGTYAIASSTAQTSARKACSFLYSFRRMRKRKSNKYKKLSAHNVCTQRSLWSE